MAGRLPDQHVYVEALDLGKRMATTLEEMAGGGERVVALEEGDGERGPTIHAVPDNLRQGNKEAFEPALVAIGPLHRSKPKLRQMEHLKWRCLQDLIDREPKMEVQAFVNAVWPLEQKARREYCVPIDYGPSEFVKLLVLDGCFLLEFLIKRAMGLVYYLWKHAQGNLPMLRNDLLLLENQIPFFVLESLFKVRYPNGLLPPGSTTTLSIMDIALEYIDMREVPMEQLKEGRTRVKQHEMIHHLLHLHYLCQLLHFDYGAAQPPSPVSCWNRSWRTAYDLLLGGFYFLLALILTCERPRPCPRPRTQRHFFMHGAIPRSIPSATNLRKAGVRFRSKEGARCYLNVSFSEESHTLAIPYLFLQENIVSSLRNLIAFEQCCPDIDELEKHITAYATFMDKIMDTPEDVAVLVRHGIIEHKLATDEDVATLFKDLTKGASFHHRWHYLLELFEQVNAYYESSPSRWVALLVDVAVVGMLLTLVGTVASVVQAVYSGMSYKKG